MKLEIKWVIIFFVLHVLWHFGEQAMGFYGDRAGNQELSSLGFFALYGLLMALPILDLRKQNKGYLNRRHGLVSSIFMGLVLVALAPIMVLLLAYVIQPDFFNIMIMHALDNDEYQVYEAAAKEYNYWYVVRNYIAGYALVGIIGGAFWSYIFHRMPEPVTD